ncbi:hypothetical protein TRFO_43041 [Tritrichomonas foetus]|uniref:AB hydrolase-1 domain-containing protein n=1 Tax=Tritrichomonas foetus TaxID=1144522 RepID=A0A1J4KU73_9EUKA|nr:hypothetical protein TRFO_43041 [Tritrichomonas foetus]|eukprot:OHT14456.1 hypothetical protein TRFO_43041 [Tritrichomonas foetus]
MKSVMRWAIKSSISPPRCTYDPSNTITIITDENNKIYVRKKIEIISNDIPLQCSLWHSHDHFPTKCLIYLHSAGMNQFEALNIVPYFVTSDISLFAFDFPGCGQSGGEFLPFDGSGPPHVMNCVTHLKNCEGIQSFFLWGRSMGAAIALQTVSNYPSEFVCVVSDSSFSNLSEELRYALRKKGIPKMFIGSIEKMLKNEVKKYFNFDIDYKFPLADVINARTPLLMGHGKQDTFVSLKQGEKIFQKYGTLNKQLYVFDATHFKSRPYFWYEMAARFVYRYAEIDVKPRFYEFVYGGSMLHVGDVEDVMNDLRAQLVESESEVSDIESTESHAK